MKKLLFSVYLFMTATVIIAQSGKVYDDLSMKSSILKMDRKYAVYLPPDYETSQRTYPVLYLLHGYGDSQRSWIHFCELPYFVDKAINEGKATPMIIVMPDANTRARYGNDVKGEWPFEDFFFKEFIPYIETTYRIKSEKAYRAIGGNSMGGWGAFLYGLHHPDFFVAACPLSAATGPLTLDEAKKTLMRQDPNIPDSLVLKYFKTQSVPELINQVPDDQKKAVRWYIDCGDDDFLYEGNSLVHIAMRKMEIPHEFRMRQGGHGWGYWRVSLPSVLEFVTDAFHR